MSALRDPRMRHPALLELACGLRSAIERFDRLLARHVPAKPAPACAAPDDLTLVVLGLIALRDRLDRELTGAVARTADRTAERAADPAADRAADRATDRAADQAAAYAPTTLAASSAPARLEGLLR